MNSLDRNDSDAIILHSVESYMKAQNIALSTNPQERLIITQQARDYLYSDIARRFPRVAGYILGSDMATDSYAKGMFISLSKHVMDPNFVNVLMQYLAQQNIPKDNGISGALLAKIMNKYLEDNKPATVKKDKKGDEPVETNNPMNDVKHIHTAIEHLLGDIASIVSMRCGNITHPEALAIAACIAMNNMDTITEIIASDLPVSAKIFDVVADPSSIIKNALLIDKNQFTKLTTNQNSFVESLKVWVYDKLNIIPVQASYQFLVATYGSVKPNVTNYLIQIKDCGMTYSNLLTVAKQLCNG